MTKQAKFILTIAVLLLTVKVIGGTIQDFDAFSAAYSLTWDGLTTAISERYVFLDVMFYTLTLIGLGLRGKIGWFLLLTYPLVLATSWLWSEEKIGQVVLGLVVAGLLVTKPILTGFSILKRR